MKKTILLLAGLLLAGRVCAQEKEQIKQPADEVFETIWEHRFEEPVVDVIFDEAEMTVKEARKRGWKDLKGKKDDEKVALPNPKVKFNESEIIFLDDKGKIRRKIDISYQDMFKFKKSNNEKYIGVKTISKIERDEKGIKNADAKFLMFDNAGNLLWEIPKYFYDFIPSPDGQYVIELPDVEWSAGPLNIYNLRGLVKEIRKPNEMFGVDFSKNGEYIALTLYDHKNKNGHLILMGRDGNELWRQTIGVYPKSVSISGNGELLAVTAGEFENNQRKIYVFNKLGKLLLKEDVYEIGTYEIKFSDDNKLLLVTNGARVYLFDVKKNSLLWEYKINKIKFGGMCVAPNFDLTLIVDLGNDKREDLIYLLNKAGENILIGRLGVGELWREKVYPYKAQTKLSLKAPKIFVKTKSGIKILRYDFPTKDSK